jgi:hypothetical protein
MCELPAGLPATGMLAIKALNEIIHTEANKCHKNKIPFL